MITTSPSPDIISIFTTVHIVCIPLLEILHKKSNWKLCFKFHQIPDLTTVRLARFWWGHLRSLSLHLLDHWKRCNIQNTKNTKIMKLNIQTIFSFYITSNAREVQAWSCSKFPDDVQQQVLAPAQIPPFQVKTIWKPSEKISVVILFIQVAFHFLKKYLASQTWSTCHLPAPTTASPSMALLLGRLPLRQSSS